MTELISLKKIWDAGAHNAFTDLLHSDGRWLCTFREAQDHGSADGAIRVIESTDGEEWSSVARLVEVGKDLRDPKISLMPDSRFFLLMGASTYTDKGRYLSRSPRVAFSDDGRTWTPPIRVLAEDHWLWRVTWHGDTGYAVSKLGEGTNPRRGFLYRTSDGLEWDWMTEFRLPNDTWTVSETTLRILPDDQMIALIRPDWIGRSHPPYTDWSFVQTDYPLGGPNFIQVPDGSLVGSGRVRNDAELPETVLGKLTQTSFEPFFSLPSGGDNSYAGMVWHDDLLWMSYYSTHESKTSIYLAKIRLDSQLAT
jgi:hypothetical protein